MLKKIAAFVSPEIAYPENGSNGRMSANHLDAYVAAAVNLSIDPGAKESLGSGCASCAKEYTVENMACRFVIGIVAALI